MAQLFSWLVQASFNSIAYSRLQWASPRLLPTSSYARERPGHKAVGIGVEELEKKNRKKERRERGGLVL